MTPGQSDLLAQFLSNNEPRGAVLHKKDIMGLYKLHQAGRAFDAVKLLDGGICYDNQQEYEGDIQTIFHTNC